MFLIACLGSSWMASLAKQMWYDELFTYYIASVHTIPEVWRVLLEGFESHPPLYYTLGHLSMSRIGMSSEALRLPSMVAFCAFELCLFFIVVPAYGELTAWLAVFLPFATAASDYSFEARPYMIVLACGAAAFLGWQRLGERNRFGWAALLSCGIGIAVISHFYGVVAGLPVCLGEIAYLAEYRNFRKRVWLSIGIGYLSTLLLLPFALSVRAHFEGGDFDPRIYWYWADFVSGYEALFHDLLYPFLTVVIIGGVAMAIGYRARRPFPEAMGPAGFTRAELVAAVAFALAPLTVQVLSHVVITIFAPRYAITGVLGVCLLIPALVSPGGRSVTGLTLAITVACALMLGWNDARALKRLRHPLPFTTAITLSDPGIPGDLPIAVQDSVLYLRLIHYAPDNLKSRLYFPASTRLAIKYLHNPVNDRAMSGLNTVAPLHVVPFEEFTAAHRRFILYVAPDEGQQGAASGWLTAALLEMGAQLRLVAHRENASVFDVTLK